MNIAALGDWLSKQLEGNKNPIPAFPQPMPQKPQPTIQQGVPVPSYRPTANGGFEVIDMPKGGSAFADYVGLGVLKNPPTGVVYFDPSGQATPEHHGYKGNYMAMPMAMPEFEQMPYMQKIGVGY